MVEEQLRTTLERAATAGPPPPVDLLDRVETGHRRRRRTRRAAWSGLAGVVVLAVLAATALLPRAGTDPVVTSSPSPAPSVREPLAQNAAPADQVWPQAVITVPARFGGGTNEPITMLDEHRMLLAVRVSDAKVGSLAVYDTRTGTEKLLTDLPDPPGVRGYWPGGFTAADGVIVWTVGVFGQDGSQASEYWTMRDDGTGKRRVSGVTGVGERLVIVDGTLYGSPGSRTGIMRMPVAGGTPEKIPGSEGFEIARWPWAVTADSLGTDRPEAWNLVTGERRTPKPRPRPTHWWTAADQDVWLGVDEDNGLTFAQATDGSWELTTSWFDPQSIVGGRFVGGRVKNRLHPNDPQPPALWDLRTGLVGTLTSSSFRTQVARPLAWSVAGPLLHVVDVARI